VYHGFIPDLSCCLRLADEESFMELLPELKELDLSYPYSRSWPASGDRPFASSLDGRQNAGHSVALR